LKKTFMSGFVSGALRDKLLFYYSYSYFLFWETSRIRMAYSEC
jgi:hypothetical protein